MKSGIRIVVAGLALACLSLMALATAPAAAQALGPAGDMRAQGPGLVRPVYGIAGECHPIDFDGVDIRWNRARGVYQLTVTGIKQFANMEVSLAHQSYSVRPYYWASVVVGCWKNFIVIPIPTPYYVTMPLDHFVGTRGVEIIGATRVVKRLVPRS
jgi:hypothetical protein